jgi:hypothetical protein
MESEEHGSAVQRLDAALVEQDRLRERYDAAIGTSIELGRLRPAGGRGRSSRSAGGLAHLDR